MIHGRAFVRHVGNVAEDQKPVAEFRRNPKLPAIASLERDTGPFSERRRRAAKIHGNVENDTARRTNELPLRVYLLEVQSPKHVLHRSTVTVLRKMCRQS